MAGSKVGSGANSGGKVTVEKNGQMNYGGKIGVVTMPGGKNCSPKGGKK
jgi:hypothetical protein